MNAQQTREIANAFREIAFAIRMLAYQVGKRRPSDAALARIESGIDELLERVTGGDSPEDQAKLDALTGRLGAETVKLETAVDENKP